MTQRRRLIDFYLAMPRTFLARVEDLDRDVLVSPLATPDLAVPALAQEYFLLDLTSYRPLHQQWTSCVTTTDMVNSQRFLRVLGFHPFSLSILTTIFPVDLG